LDAFGSVIFPKILGSYERELSNLIESLCQKPYSSVVDIGCAEGYYAVGLARRIPNTKVYAFDSSERAQALCSEMAQKNGVSVEIGGVCNKTTLFDMDLGPRALIICDCEGDEMNIFDKETAHHLEKHDVIIESHDCFNIEITHHLYEVFSSTHTITEIESIDDTLKAYRYNYPELASFSLEEKREFLRECRRGIMRWLYMEPK
jgi:precorrin-6B methylase 2